MTPRVRRNLTLTMQSTCYQKYVMTEKTGTAKQSLWSTTPENTWHFTTKTQRTHGHPMTKQELISRLNNLFDPAAVQNWLNKYNKVFNARPIDLLDSGRFEQVERMIVELEHGLLN